MMKTGLDRIRQLVEEHPDRKVQTVMHMVNKETLAGVHARQDANKASGVDEITKRAYEENLDVTRREKHWYKRQ